MGIGRRKLTVYIVTIAVTTSPLIAIAQSNEDSQCAFICTPEFKVEPQITFENLFFRSRVEDLGDGVTAPITRQDRESVFELAIVMGIPTEIPRIGFTVETILSPFGETDLNSFTGSTPSVLSSTAIRDNGIELEFEVNFDWLTADQTGGWIASHFDVVDKFSPAERPTDTSLYTHKLNFELDTAFLIFHWLPEDNWLKTVELEGSLDYVATGLPNAGDIVGGQRYLDDASRWSFSLLAVVPLAPLFP